MTVEEAEQKDLDAALAYDLAAKRAGSRKLPGPIFTFEVDMELVKAADKARLAWIWATNEWMDLL